MNLLQHALSLHWSQLNAEFLQPAHRNYLWFKSNVTADVVFNFLTAASALCVFVNRTVCAFNTALVQTQVWTHTHRRTITSLRRFGASIPRSLRLAKPQLISLTTLAIIFTVVINHSSPLLPCPLLFPPLLPFHHSPLYFSSSVVSAPLSLSVVWCFSICARAAAAR